MSLTLALVLAAVAAGVAYVVARALAGRELAEAVGASAAELAAARRDNAWLQQGVARQQDSAGAAQDTADKRLASMREAFQSLAAEALHTNRNAFFDLARTAVQTHPNNARIG